MTRERNKRRVVDSGIAECTSAFKRMAVTVASDEIESQKANLQTRGKSKSWRRKTQSRQVDNTKTQPKTDKFTLSLEDQISAMLKIIRAESESEIKPAITPSTSFSDACVDSSNEHKLCRKMSKNTQESKDDSCLEDKQVSGKPLLSSKPDELGVEKKSIAIVVTKPSLDPSPQVSSVGTEKSSVDQSSAGTQKSSYFKHSSVGTQKSTTVDHLSGGTQKSSSVDQSSVGIGKSSVDQNSAGTQKSSSVVKRKCANKSKQSSRKRGRREDPDKSSKQTKTSSGDDGMLDRLVRLFSKLTL